MVNHLFLRVMAGALIAAAWMVAPAMARCDELDGNSGRIMEQVVQSPAQDAEAVLDFWTDARMREAVADSGSLPPIAQKVITPDGDASGYAQVEPPYTINDPYAVKTGMLFSELPDGQLSTCSASVVISRNKLLILTAAHCVYNYSGQSWLRNVLFIPAYNASAENIAEQIPLGKWPLNQSFILKGYAPHTTDTDVAVASVFPQPNGERVEDVVGGGFLPKVSEENEDFHLVKIYGYPGGSYLDGKQRFCWAHAWAMQGDTSLNTFANCPNIGGNSGGPNIVDGRQPEVVGVVKGVFGSQTRLRESLFGVVYRFAQIAKSPIEENPDEVLAFWTDERMDAAWPSHNMPGRPLLGPPLLEGADQSGYVRMPAPYAEHRLSRMSGILFYREANNGGVGHCSAAVITSGSKSLVVSAAHCVKNFGWREMMMFVPAYDGAATGKQRVPLLKWPVRQAFIPYEGAGGRADDDVAVARLYPENVPIGPSVTVEQLVGGGFDPRMSEDETFLPSVKILGYPSAWIPGDGPYALAVQRRCDSPAISDVGNPGLVAPYCATQGGNSGGPLVWDHDSTVEPQVVGVVHNTSTHARLKPSTFGVIYEAADAESDSPH
ncbi:trypsin-like serine protease [Dyella sp. M7H15-1]|uniref:trypsin-like serine peptidase n=1 Tax=Dyella sp. M7H15-1 TaxID=2501295 RepID=UPI001004F538|nr:trypsin-like serine protease [Dyella sp. M7H15-1]QAU23313.1 trypsin-like serine protease [Dyella sp. M7H15-1]